jgi:putative transposase
MARSKESHIRGALTSVLSPRRIARRARELGIVKRRRKVHVVALVTTLVLSFERGARRSVASLRRAYAAATGTTLAASAFYDRFTSPLAQLLRELSEHAFADLAQHPSKLHGALAAFARLLVADGSLLRLRDELEADYPSVWTNHTRASAKLHVVIDAVTRTPRHVRIAPGSSHDLSLMTLDCLLHWQLVRLRSGLLPRKAISPDHRAWWPFPLPREEGCQLRDHRRRRSHLGRAQT